VHWLLWVTIALWVVFVFGGVLAWFVGRPLWDAKQYRKHLIQSKDCIVGLFLHLHTGIVEPKLCKKKGAFEIESPFEDEQGQTYYMLTATKDNFVVDAEGNIKLDKNNKPTVKKEARKISYRITYPMLARPGQQVMMEGMDFIKGQMPAQNRYDAMQFIDSTELDQILDNQSFAQQLLTSARENVDMLANAWANLSTRVKWILIVIALLAVTSIINIIFGVLINNGINNLKGLIGG